MKKKNLYLPLLILGLGTTTPAFSQLANQKGITIEEIYENINELASKGDDAAKAQLAKEAAAFAKAKKENYNLLAANIYNFLGNEEASKKIIDGLEKKYPKGSMARNKAFEALRDNESLNVDQKLAQYNAWLKKFPSTSFGEEEQGIYSQASSYMTGEYLKAKQYDKAIEFVNSFKDAAHYPNMVSQVSMEFNKNGNYTETVNFLKDIAEPLISKEGKTRAEMTLLGSYAEALVNSGDVEKGIVISQDLIKASGNYPRPVDVINVAKGYHNLGQSLDAFQFLEEYYVNKSQSNDVLKVLETQYAALNNNKGDFNQYKNKLDLRVETALKDKYKATMVKNEAPSFKLQNMKGEFVSLEDLRGKIVVIDFWATWCGPCIVSFPGMQAAVNKYKDDPEVEFLFVNTWQSEDNYKELVTNFIAENNYTFHVLYDEMKDSSKATVTAYGVKGIPTKVFIDKNGFIRFQSAGGSADVGVVLGEMVAKIELIKEAQKSE